MSIENRKGIVTISRKILTENPDVSFLKSLFSNFFPVGTEIENNPVFYDGIKFYGYSLYFRELNSGEKIPNYEIEFKLDDKRKTIFVGAKEQKR